MIDNELSLFGTPDPEPVKLEEPSEAGSASLVESVDEVFELASTILGNEADVPETPALARAQARREAKAEELGLVARWGDYRKAKGHASIHDPTSGSWHDLP